MNLSASVSLGSNFGRSVAWVFLGAVLAGCASNSPLTISPDSGLDGGDLADAQDGSIEDAGHDGARSLCSSEGWCRVSLPGVSHPTLNGVFAVSPTRAVATADDGRILLWNGSVWKTVALDLGQLRGIWASDENHFWIVNESIPSLYRVTFDGDIPSFATEDLPYDFSPCGGGGGGGIGAGINGGGSPLRLSISGTAEDDIFVAAGCYSDDDGTAAGAIFHRGTTGDGGAPTWSVLWSTDATVDVPTELAGVIAVARGNAWAVGWEASAILRPGDIYVDGLKARVVHVVPDAPVDDQVLDIGMCAGSVWAHEASGSVFIAGQCQQTDVSGLQYVSMARRDPSGSWIPIFTAPSGGASINPSLAWGFAETDVYGAGLFAVHWDGTALRTIALAVNGSPVGHAIRGLHGSAANDIWMVGDGFALHRTQ